jgi:hypothetical protein
MFLHVYSCYPTNQQFVWNYISAFHIWHSAYWFFWLWNPKSGMKFSDPPHGVSKELVPLPLKKKHKL